MVPNVVDLKPALTQGKLSGAGTERERIRGGGFKALPGGVSFSTGQAGA